MEDTAMYSLIATVLNLLWIDSLATADPSGVVLQLVAALSLLTLLIGAIRAREAMT
jgi:hypothetical protein